ncbi:unnamed protein product [Rotaria magnacalcarata]|uniref:Uncharacterized protein n=1 Tax=Rotaria magnacalcarata TaxID=392030 RepID=A0A819T0Y8_9BILA|nr:unnamed protein product [Rotaria magnacalcarata]
MTYQKNTYKHKASRPPPSPSTVHTASIVKNDCMKQAQIAIGNLTKEITAREILLAQCHRDLEQQKLKNFNQLYVNGNHQLEMVNNEQIESEELQRDIDDLKRMQQEHISKSYPNPLASPFDDLDEEHVAWLKKKNTKIIGSIVEQFQVLYDHVYVLDKN